MRARPASTPNHEATRPTWPKTHEPNWGITLAAYCVTVWSASGVMATRLTDVPGGLVAVSIVGAFVSAPAGVSGAGPGAAGGSQNFRMISGGSAIHSSTIPRRRLAWSGTWATN